MMRAHRAVGWLLLAGVAAYLVLIVAGQLGLIDPVAKLIVGSIAALAIGLGAVAFIAIYLVTQNRLRRQAPLSADDRRQKRTG